MPKWPFRLPAILVGDGRLGGISGTISAYESLKFRGYDVVAVVFEDHGLVNEVPLSCYLQNGTVVCYHIDFAIATSGLIAIYFPFYFLGYEMDLPYLRIPVFLLPPVPQDMS
ncbi:hypothetical protein ACH5RR_020900 [Cinchona calisaya]|uniref:Uncharacterized protein n=1 Tax=Cinchona calisaya TaxID=153742 RepID=A0ABD2ZFU3_9GENT